MLGWQHFLSPHCRKWGSRHILDRGEAAPSQAEPEAAFPNPAAQPPKQTDTASRGPSVAGARLTPGVRASQGVGAKPASLLPAPPSEQPRTHRCALAARHPAHIPQPLTTPLWGRCAVATHPGGARGPGPEGVRHNTGHAWVPGGPGLCGTGAGPSLGEEEGRPSTGLSPSREEARAATTER